MHSNEKTQSCQGECPSSHLEMEQRDCRSKYPRPQAPGVPAHMATHRNRCHQTHTHNDASVSKNVSRQLEGLNGQSWNHLSNIIDEVLLDYNPSYKMNIHESLLLQIDK